MELHMTLPAAYSPAFNPHNVSLKHGLLLPKLVEFFNSTNIVINNFAEQNSQFWTIVPTFSRDVLVQSMTVRNPRNVGQTDGVDPESCVECHIDFGDDGVSIKAYDVACFGPAPCSNVTVRRTTVVSRNICVGAATVSGASDILFEDVTVGDPKVPPGSTLAGVADELLNVDNSID